MAKYNDRGSMGKGSKGVARKKKKRKKKPKKRSASGTSSVHKEKDTHYGLQKS